MKKENTISMRIEFDIYNYLLEKSIKNRTNISQEIRKILYETYNEESGGL